MKPFLFTVLSLFACATARAQSPALEERWYENPLGFPPLDLHARNAFLLPAVAVGLGLLLTDRDPALAERLTVFDDAGIARGYKSPHTTLYQNDLGVSYRCRSWLAAGVELTVQVPRDDYNRTTGIGVRPFARFYPAGGDRWRVYFEAGGGLIRFRDEFPRPTPDDARLGTGWNGTTKYGVGAELDVGAKATLRLGARHLHVSNGDAEGAERNPSHDSNGVYLGFGLRL